MEVENLLTFTNRSQLREWFERNHLSERCCWVACNRSKAAKPDTLPYLEIVEEAKNDLRASDIAFDENIAALVVDRDQVNYARR